MITKDPLPNWSEPAAYAAWGREWMPPLECAWLSWIAHNVHPDEVVAVGRLLFPRFVEFNGGVFLEMKFKEASFFEWMAKLKRLPDVERILNHVHIHDLFSNSTDAPEESYMAVAELLAATWRQALGTCFPDQSFVVEVSADPDGDPVVTFAQSGQTAST
ncbi:MULTISPECIES: hypothetical protein [unclassified Chelatococcus]|uniref:hypothetical protein n=1 Tax=unclassified Chelatococcus TaxID=2638111 RepID=UPI000300CF7F|nr:MULTISPECIES: hypothetical protein [unclassified Chelatococcus]ALA20339.1 hypothetical protein AL346_23285 [Chelatococcus sp. CO-6]